MQVNWQKLSEIIKSQKDVGGTDAGLARTLGVARTVINDWRAGRRDLSITQKLRMLQIGGYADEFKGMLSVYPKPKQDTVLAKIRNINNEWNEYLRENEVKQLPFPPFAELIELDEPGNARTKKKSNSKTSPNDPGFDDIELAISPLENRALVRMKASPKKSSAGRSSR